MATIDLKNTIITIRDGATGITQGIGDAGAVNNVAGYNAGATSMQVDALTGIVVSGQTFTVTGETGAPTHTVTGHTETGGNTTSVSFTPALASDIADNVVVTFVAEATGNHQIEVKLGTGTLSYTEARTIEYRLDRGVLNTVRQGDEVPVDVSFDFEWEYLRSATGELVTVEEALKQTGAAADWISSSADLCEPYAVDVVIEYIPPCSESDAEVIILQDFRWESLDHNARDGQISCSGKCNVREAVVSRVAQASIQNQTFASRLRDNRMNKVKQIMMDLRNKEKSESEAPAKSAKEKVA